MVVLSQENWAGQGKQSKYWVKTCLQTGTFKNESTKDSLLVWEITHQLALVTNTCRDPALSSVIDRTLRPYCSRQPQTPLKAYPRDEWEGWAHSWVGE